MGFLAQILHKLKQKRRHGLLRFWLMDRLAACGLEIRGMYLFEERISRDPSEQFGDRFKDYKTRELTADDMDELDRVDGRDFTVEVLRERLKDGRRCIGLIHEGRIACFTWINLKTFWIGSHHFSLRPNEVYLYDLHTLKAYRGRGLAVYIRFKTYERVSQWGRDVCYSFSDMLNQPAIRFKKKLNARIARSYMFINLFGRWSWAWMLKQYEDDRIQEDDD